MSGAATGLGEGPAATGSSVLGPGVLRGRGSPLTGAAPSLRQLVEGAEATLEAERCQVPALRRYTLEGARNRLRRANCRLGAVVERRGVTARTGRVIDQSVDPGVELKPRARVGVTLGALSRLASERS